jgi:hypothetical protein
VCSIIFDYTVRISSYLTTIMKTALKQNNCSKGDLISNVINIYRLYKRPCKISFNLKDLRSLSLQTSTCLLESTILIFIDRQIIFSTYLKFTIFLIFLANLDCFPSLLPIYGFYRWCITNTSITVRTFNIKYLTSKVKKHSGVMSFYSKCHSIGFRSNITVVLLLVVQL